MAIQTERGQLRVLPGGAELDWPYAKGHLACDEAIHHEALIASTFEESLARGYIEEEASVHAIMACAMHPHLLWRGGPAAHRAAFPRLSLPADRESQHSFPRLLRPSPGVYPVVDSLALLDQLLEAGAGIIQLRIKDIAAADQETAVRSACRVAEQVPNCQLFINDHWQAALHHGAHGIHLGQEDLLAADLSAIAQQGMRLGLSSHSYWEVARANWIAPSYLACGPIFPTRAKAMNWIPQGIENLRYWVAVSDVPVVAIAGIHAGNLMQIAQTGAAAAAVIQAVVSMPDPSRAYRDLQATWLRASASSSPLPSSWDQAPPAGWPARPTLSPTHS